MNNTLRHLVIIFFDLLCIWGLWLGYDNIKQTLSEINNQVEIIRFGSRDGFFIVGIGFPFLHLLISIEQIWPDFINKFRKYKRLINNCIIGLIACLLVAGFAISYWLETRVENAGYVHCWYVSGASALAKTVVYAKDIKICDDLEAEARAKLN